MCATRFLWASGIVYHVCPSRTSSTLRKERFSNKATTFYQQVDFFLLDKSEADFSILNLRWICTGEYPGRATPQYQLAQVFETKDTELIEEIFEYRTQLFDFEKARISNHFVSTRDSRKKLPDRAYVPPESTGVPRSWETSPRRTLQYPLA